ncbi:MAG: iron ABC transporter permease [Anaerolineae bacterium]|nr:iron ABC transporter permease [Anaerolineae bacterium]
MKRRPYLTNTLLLAAALILSVAAGAVTIPPGTLVRILLTGLPVGIVPDWPEAFTAIVLQVRLPHTALMLVTGMALAGSGAAYQGVFRNPLADPYLIGVASGAGLGAVLALALDWPQSWLGFFTVPIFAFAGAVITVGIVYQLARVGRTTPTTTLILAGVAVGSFATSLTSFLMLRSDEELRRALSWLLGGGILTGWEPVAAILPGYRPRTGRAAPVRARVERNAVWGGASPAVGVGCQSSKTDRHPRRHGDDCGGCGFFGDHRVYRPNCAACGSAGLGTRL